MNASVIRVLEDLLRRVLHSTEHGIDEVALTTSARRQAVMLRSRRRLGVAVTVALALALLLIGWFLHEWTSG